MGDVKRNGTYVAGQILLHDGRLAGEHRSDGKPWRFVETNRKRASRRVCRRGGGESGLRGRSRWGASNEIFKGEATPVEKITWARWRRQKVLHGERI